MTSLLVPALGSYGPGDRNRRDGTSRGVAVAAVSRRSGKQAAVVDTRCAFRRSASLSYRERGPPNLPLTRRILRAAMTLALMKERYDARAILSTSSSRRRGPIHTAVHDA